MAAFISPERMSESTHSRLPSAITPLKGPEILAGWVLDVKGGDLNDVVARRFCVLGASPRPLLVLYEDEARTKPPTAVLDLAGAATVRE
eukprot:2273167-Prymnesium_polylepis.1